MEERKEEEFWRDILSQQGYRSPTEAVREALDWSHWFLENMPHMETNYEEFE